MLMDVPLVADLEQLRRRRQHLINTSLMRENKKRIDYNYEVGEKVWIKVYDPTKMDAKLRGPFKISRVYVNGTVQLQMSDTVFQRFNIRKIVPFRHLEEAHFFIVEDVFG
jgi:hypothetical protein